jgi:L-cysteine S-thiosulfotransferase
MKRALLVLALLGSVTQAQEPKRSTFDDMKPETQAMQRDDMANPAMLWVQDGLKLWNEKAGATHQSCADCHQTPASMRGVATRYPAYQPGSQTIRTLDQQILACRSEQQKADPFTLETRPVLALSALIGLQSRGLPLAPATTDEAPFVEKGRALFFERRGQLNLSCAQCHNDHAGQSLGGARIPQGHPTGYPLYRLEWQDMGSLERRLRNCLTGVRSVALPYGSPDLVALQIFLRDRASGLPIETPALRP